MAHLVFYSLSVFSVTNFYFSSSTIFLSYSLSVISTCSICLLISPGFGFRYSIQYLISYLCSSRLWISSMFFSFLGRFEQSSSRIAKAALLSSSYNISSLMDPRKGVIEDLMCPANRAGAYYWKNRIKIYCLVTLIALMSILSTKTTLMLAQ